MIRRLLLVVLVLVAALPATASALSVSEVARELRCPTCNQPLDVSHAPAAQQMKRYIAARIDEGWDKDQIIDALVADFGPEVLATPPKSGFNLLAWVVPLAILLLGLIAVPIITRAWARHRAGPGDDEPPELSAEDAARVDEELRRTGD